MYQYFNNIDFKNFWENSEYEKENYISEKINNKLIKEVELNLGYKLPDSYIYLMEIQNGGIPINTCFPTMEKNGWADGFIQISGIYGIGKEKDYSLLGNCGSKFWIEEWGYPNIGIAICDTPSAGHEMIMLDYSDCGRDGEPKVIYVDQENDYYTIVLSNNFESFIQGLVSEKIYDTSEEDLIREKEIIKNGKFSTLLSNLVKNFPSTNFENIIRKLALLKTEDFKAFAFHSDEISYMVYDILFLLYSSSNKVNSIKNFMLVYKELIAFGDGEFSTGGFAPSFIEDWMEKRIKNKEIVKNLFFGLSLVPNIKKVY